MKFSIRDRITSFKHAYQGFFILIRSEHNAWIHSFVAVLVIILGFIFHVSTHEWMWIIISITSVFAAELFNTSIEKLCDLIHPKRHPEIGKVKDLSAAAVLILALGAGIVGTIIFLPRIINLLN